ncbi:MAG: hypothetical protein ACE5J5_08135 [Candidatus Hydrothermarchaeales archaeon]
MNLLGYKIKALDFWRNNGHTAPKCNSCDNSIPWGDGFILDDSKFMCNPCVEKNFDDGLNKIL